MPLSPPQKNALPQKFSCRTVLRMASPCKKNEKLRYFLSHFLRPMEIVRGKMRLVSHEEN